MTNAGSKLLFKVQKNGKPFKAGPVRGFTLSFFGTYKKIPARKPAPGSRGVEKNLLVNYKNK